jgi:hypothetical protein
MQVFSAFYIERLRAERVNDKEFSRSQGRLRVLFYENKRDI